MTIARRTRITVSIAALAAAGACLAAAGTAQALVPNYPATIEMRITNGSAQTLYLQGSDNPYGDWIVSPKTALGPGETETVSASTWRNGGFGLDVTYGTGANTTAVFMANNYAGASDTDGTRIDGPNASHFDIQSSIDTGAPDMSANYLTLPPLR